MGMENDLKHFSLCGSEKTDKKQAESKTALKMQKSPRLFSMTVSFPPCLYTVLYCGRMMYSVPRYNVQ